MVAVIAALYDEVFLLLRELKYTKIDGIPQYTGKINDVSVALYLCKPAAPKIAKLQKFMKQHPFRFYVNAGFAGSLVTKFEYGDPVFAKKVGSFQKENFFLKPEKMKNLFEAHNLVTVNQPVFSLEEKEDTYFLSKAEIVDMEAHRLLKASSDIGIKLDKWRILKIIGDMPGDEYFLQKEVAFRDFFSSHGFFKKLKIVRNTGIRTSWFLYKRKKFLQKKLYDSLFKILDFAG